MTAREFCYWLQGMFELAQPGEFNAEQTAMIKRHLAMVFVHDIDPSYPKEQKPALDVLHAGTGSAPTQTQTWPGVGGPLIRC